MRTETTYYAFDETEFDNEQDCLDYERGLTKLSGSVQWFTEDRALMKETDLQDVESIAMYFRVVDADAAAEFFDWLPTMISFDKPECKLENGQVFAYDTDTGGWDDMRELIRRISSVIEEIESEATDHADP